MVRCDEFSKRKRLGLATIIIHSIACCVSQERQPVGFTGYCVSLVATGYW